MDSHGEGRSETRAGPSLLAFAALAAALLVALVGLAYGPVLLRYFSERDDPSLLWSAATGVPILPHFRPVQALQLRVLLALFGPAPLPFHAANLALHLANAGLLCALLVRLGVARASALGGSLVFVSFFAPSEAVLWISASSVLLCAFFALLALHLCLSARRHAWARALLPLAFAGALGSREDAVIVLPALALVWWLVPGRPALARRGWLVPAVLVLLLAGYLALAFRPSHWAADPSLGRYAFDATLVPRFLRSLAALAWPSTEHPTELLWLVGLVELAALLLSLRWFRRDPAYLLGAYLLVAGFLPALPGPFETLENRFTYLSTLGLGCFVAALLGGFQRSLARSAWSGPAQRALRLALAVALFAACALEALAIRSVENWRYRPFCERLEALVASTRLELERNPGREVRVASPVCWSAIAYAHALELALGLRHEELALSSLPFDERLPEAFAPGGPFDRARVPTFHSTLDGVLRPLRADDPLPLRTWEGCANEREERGHGKTVAVLTIRRER